MPRNQGTSRKGKPKKEMRAAGFGKALQRCVELFSFIHCIVIGRRYGEREGGVPICSRCKRRGWCWCMSLHRHTTTTTYGDGHHFHETNDVNEWGNLVLYFSKSSWSKKFMKIVFLWFWRLYQVSWRRGGGYLLCLVTTMSFCVLVGWCTNG